MKRNKFLSGVGAKLALAMLTLSSAMFTSCEKEDFNIEVALNPAKVYINTTVIYVDADGNATDVTNSCSLSYSGATQSGTQGIIEGTESSPAISATTVTVTAAYNGLSDSETVSVSSVAAASSAAYSVTILLAEELSEYSIEQTTTVGEPETIWGEGGTYSHEGNYWYENASEYLLSVDIEYPIYATYEVVDYTVSSGYEDLITYIENFKATVPSNKTTATYTCQVSAYCIYNAYYTKTTTDITYKIYYGDTEIGTVYVETVTSTTAEVEEDAHPDHASHYSIGHGHSDSTNAGGGIVLAD